MGGFSNFAAVSFSIISILTGQLTYRVVEPRKPADLLQFNFGAIARVGLVVRA